jgi:hypothetical protein
LGDFPVAPRRNEGQARLSCISAEESILFKYTPNAVSVKFFPGFLPPIFSVPSYFLKIAGAFGAVSVQFE